MRLLYFIVVLQFTFATAFAQNSWNQSYSSAKVFIENKGQFDAYANAATGDIEFAADFGSTRVFFGKKGISYSFLEAKKVPKDERAHLMERINHKTQHDYKQWEKVIGKFHYRADQVNMVWENANCELILAVGQRKDYHSYAFHTPTGETANVNYVKGFEKITYKNIYPNIDIEYIVHPQEGLKYAVILHPGANPKEVKMVYDRAVKLDNGKIKIATLFGDIVDHEPLTFYGQNTKSIIKSNFVLSGQTVSFGLGDYDKSQTVVIDPWTQTPQFASNWDCIWEVDKDAAGNVYAIGGILPMQLLKYDASGALQWTFNTTYDTVNDWLGSLATTSAGESFVCNGSSAKILSVSTTGALNWSNNNPQGTSFTDEFWSIAFNCDQTKLVIGGTRLVGLNPAPRIFDVNMTNGNVLSSFQVTPPPTGFGAGHEVRAITHCDNDKYYYLTHDTLGYISSDFSACGGMGASNIKYGSQHNFSYKSENFREGNSGHQSLKTYGDFVFVHRGDIVEKRNFSTGAILASVAIPGGLFINTSVFGISTRQVGCSGIDIDECGNVYVGATNGVVKFNVDLVQQATYPTAFIVYDVHVTTGGNIVCGGSTGTSTTATRSGGIQHINANACAALVVACCDASICPVPNLCVIDAPIIVTASTSGGTWSGPGMSADGTFNPAVAGIGTHVITYTLPCGSESQTIVVSPCQALSVCIELNGTYTASNGVGPYTWQNQTLVQNCSACFIGCFFPAGCAVDVPTWTTYATGTNVPPPSTFPIRVIDNSGTEVIFYSPADIPPCDANPCPTLMPSANSTSVTCNGLNNGTASVSTTGGAAPYTYSWTNGVVTLTGASQTNLAPGTYTVTISDANNCPGTITITITEPAPIVVTSTNITPTDCGAATGSATVSASGGIGTLTYAWSPSGGNAATASNLSAGQYTVTVTDANGCSQSLNVTIISSSGPTITDIVVINPTCANPNGGQITVSASGGSGSLTYQLGNGTPQSSNVFSNLGAGTFTITVTDGNCPTTSSTTLTIPSPPTLTPGNIVPANCGESNGSATVNVSNGSGNYTYSWSPSNNTTQTATNLAAGVYVVTVTDVATGCTQTFQMIVPALGAPTLVLNNTATSCFGSSDGTITASVNGGTAPYTYVLGNGAPQASPNFSNLVAGTYQITVLDADNCPVTVETTITSPPQIVVTTSDAQSICVGQSNQLSGSAVGGTGALVLSWDNGLTGTNPTVSPNSTAVYTLTATDANGCTGSAQVTITVLPLPIALGSPVDLTGNAPLLVNFTNSSSNANNYVWTFGNGQTQTTSASFNVNTTYNQAGVYTVTLVASNGICSDTWQGTITVLPVGELLIHVPNVFSPNGDGANDEYGVFTTNADSQQAAIFNRWGNLIIELNEPNVFWDGKIDGIDAVEGVYFLKYRIKGLDGTEIEGQTFFHLVR